MKGKKDSGLIEEAWKDYAGDVKSVLASPVAEKLSGDPFEPPVLKCDHCYAKHTCKSYRAQSLCSIDFAWVFDPELEFDTAIEDSLKDLIRVQFSRIKRFVHFEMLAGGLGDDKIPDDILVFIRLIERLRKMQGKEDSKRGRKKAEEPAKKKPGKGLLSEMLKQ